MSNIDRQQYERIQQTLLGFRSGTLSLSDLIEQVPSMIKELDPPADWKNEFVGYWWTLEQVHEEAIEIGESRRLPPERRQSVDTAIEGMDRLINGVLANA